MRRRSWLRGVVVGTGVVLLASVVGGAIVLRPILFRTNAYKAVASIEERPEFHDAALLAKAWALPVASAYSRHPYEFQSNPSFCGPASMANLLHSLDVTFSQDEILRGTKYQPWFGILLGGLTLDDLADLLRQRLDRPVRVVRDLSLAAFRDAMRSSNDPKERIVINFHRGPLFGRGNGHFSPVLGYLPDRDLVLVGDVNGDYRPFLVSSERLWQAAATIDDASRKPRGLLVIDTAVP